MKPTSTDGALNGWADLCTTFGDASLAVPPIPRDHRKRLLRSGEWFWSTRADINPFKMYMFDYVQEILNGNVDDYSAVSHCGHGANSYGLNVTVVRAPLALTFQHLWGGVYTNPLTANVEIAASFFFMRALLRAVENARTESSETRYLVAWSSFRGVANYYIKKQNGKWAKKVSLQPSRVSVDADIDAWADDNTQGVDAACRQFLKYLTRERTSTD